MNQSSYNTMWPRANQASPVQASMRVQNSDFVVIEEMGFEPEGEGEHVWLYIEKTGANTQWVAEQLAKIARRPVRDVGFSGQKDRHAITRQWFSIYLPTTDAPDWQAGFDINEVNVLTQTRHIKKIRRGIHQSNRFSITLREISASTEQLDTALNCIRDQGVPNYFGAQRFGHQMQNLHKAERWFAGEIKRAKRNEEDRWISATRSWLFNQVLAERVRQQSWNRILPGDLAMLAGSHSFFVVEEVDAALQQRCDEKDIHPTGPLAGRGQAGPHAEQLILQQWPLMVNGLDAKGAQAARRALRLMAQNLSWSHNQGVIMLDFTLESGGFATTVLSEVFELNDVSLQR